MHRRWLALALVSLGLTAACGPQVHEPPVDTGLDGLALVSVNPGLVLNGTKLVITGRSFVGSDIGTATLHLRGSGGGGPVDALIPAGFVDFEQLEASWDPATSTGLPGPGLFTGTASIEFQSLLDGQTYASDPVPLQLDVRGMLEPRLDFVQTGVIFVNDPIAVEGEGLMLGGDEGATVAVVEGCYVEEPTESDTGSGSEPEPDEEPPPCVPVGPAEIVVDPETPFDRTRGTFAFSPIIAGIHPGVFQGTVRLRNRHRDGMQLDGAPQPADYEVIPPKIFSITPSMASLGQYVDVSGGGFVGGDHDGSRITTLELQGTFTRNHSGTSTEVTSLLLVPEFVSGPMVRYVVNEEDELGQRIDVRTESGVFEGKIRPIVREGADSVTGDFTDVVLGIAPVRQVVWINFMPGYVESLRHFGLRAVEDRIRARVLEVARRDYQGLNVTFVLEPPDDYALYAQVDLGGSDPNGMGLLGYDNSPGKDVHNERLYDKIGGVNATTQEDGYPGYGGVFVESFFGFSQHPEGLAEELEVADPTFDLLFDPFRPDQGGEPVRASDLADGAVPELGSGAGCPAADGDRPGQIACAVWALGSMIGTTMTHEVGHSLGLANPYGEGFHDPGDQPNRLMDAGGARTFFERTELHGEGPAVFCDSEFEYLRTLLPTDGDPPPIMRPSCY